MEGNRTTRSGFTALASPLLYLTALVAICRGGPPWFPPDDDATAVIVAHFDAAKASIDYQLFNFTSEPIADALIRAHKRGVAVRLLLDKRGQASPHSQAARCKSAGLDVRLDGKHPIAHNKVRLIDGKVLLAGSFNDSRQANRNAENLTRDEDPDLVAAFAANFERHWEHGEKFAKHVAKAQPRRTRGR
jgi:phosphatidylserine/phosphatidylglycerophosphate/cardiolipin synthase-like enzyme